MIIFHKLKELNLQRYGFDEIILSTYVYTYETL